MHAVHQPHLDPFVGLPYNLFVVWPKALTLGNCILATLAADQVLRKYYFQALYLKLNVALTWSKRSKWRKLRCTHQQFAQILFLRNCAPLYYYYHHSNFTGLGRNASASFLKLRLDYWMAKNPMEDHWMQHHLSLETRTSTEEWRWVEYITMTPAIQQEHSAGPRQRIPNL